MKFLVRHGTPEDFPWIEDLGLRSIPYGVYYGRDITNDQVVRGARRSFSRLRRRLESDPSLVTLIAQTHDGEPVGYLLLETDEVEKSTGEPQAAILDLAVEPAFWGHRVVHVLVERATRETAERGLRYMIGEVTASNRRTYLQALRLGFEVERFQIVMHCGQQGRLPMPGRGDDEKAHLKSRQDRGRPRE